MGLLSEINHITKVGLRFPIAWGAARRRRLSADHHYLAVCAIFKDEAKFLREWLDFHRAVGVEHFFLYNNNSSDDFQRVLADYDHCVTLIDWPSNRYQQRAAYWDCIRRFGAKARWIAFIDIDEFLFTPDVADVRTVVRRFEQEPAILVPSPFFGSSGHQKPQPSVLAAYTKRSATRMSMKSIVNPRKVRFIGNAHEFKYYGARNLSARPPMELIRLNHYWSRSLDDLIEKCRRGDVWGNSARRIQWHFELEATLNEVEDRTILELGPDLVQPRIVFLSQRTGSAR